MDVLKKKERIERVRKMNAVLNTLFPQTTIHLTHQSTWELLVAVMLSVQCTDKRVNEVTPNLFRQFPTMNSFADVTQETLEQAIYSTGFFRAKARNIRLAARMIIKEYDGEVPHTMEDLIRLPGVGRKTANVILSNAFHQEEGIAVDTHVRRFALRFDLTDHTDPTHIERDLMEIIPQSDWWTFPHRLIEYGRAICPARKHICESHPLTVVYPDAANVWPRARILRNLNK
jgi:endonuclease III